MSRGKLSVECALREQLQRGGRYLLAVSGGVDSIALLHGCAMLQRLLKAHFEVAHVDHGLRTESVKDAMFVEKQAKLLGFEFHLKRASPPKRGNLEAWGRNLRYTFFSEICARCELQQVLTAHNANDVAETLLMRLVSNKEMRSIARIDQRRRCLRPLLLVPRAEIELFVRHHKLRFRVDKSNFDEDFLRNRVRHKLLPLLSKQFDSRIVEVLSIRAQHLAQDTEAMDEVCSRAVLPIGDLEFGTKLWRRALVKVLAELPEALRWRVAEVLFLPKLGFRIGRLHAHALVDFIVGERSALEIPGGITLCSKGGAVVVTGAFLGEQLR